MDGTDLRVDSIYMRLDGEIDTLIKQEKEAQAMEKDKSKKKAAKDRVEAKGKVKGKGNKAVKLVKTKAKAKDTRVRYCPCGCGQELARSSQFRIGHDGRVHGLFAKVKKGKATLQDAPVLEAMYALWEGGITLREAAKSVNTGDKGADVPAQAPERKDEAKESAGDTAETPDNAPVVAAA
jgi:hypothetical protein